ncbi:NHLM bacteriocin system ABC transporter, ATP-binding protein [Streptomyces sp. 1222.5]|uniref:NHLP bacteriocin export ABC transporter permease/ATPase subunit n=1 Tax=unclassified Streptomyces TaxID=2593676 RepID=UPI0008962681|nr:MULTISPECIES: NHLP bacteriocin export ABC transporter permease/ATPase subunit [unclassified Streptomyces]PKW09374.1 NHLM bacteriocin system ABC transporter ATP-binding protein [Streptomyces sp. 5112.2]SEC36952.1 NHLM bacteriocin system ABC transporter, ATP-binding protein [Streptomyces sp. 1222.5]
MSTPATTTAPARTVCLDDPTTLLYVEAGSADLFAVDRGDDPDGPGGHGPERGRRYFLCRAEAGMLLACGTGRDSRHTVVARPVLDARLTLLPLSVLDDVRLGRATLPRPAVGRTPEVDHARVLDGLTAGFTALAEALPGTLPPRQFTSLAATGRTELAARGVARSVDGVRFVRVESGVLDPGDPATEALRPGTDGDGPERYRGALEPAGPGDELVLTERDWLRAREPARLATASLLEVYRQGRLTSALTGYAVRLRATVDHRLAVARARERAELAARQVQDGKVLATAVRGFDAVLHDTDTRVRLADVAADPPLLAAVRLVASRQGFAVRPPVRGRGGGRAQDDLRAIALASGARTRTVRLEDRWWTRDLGPLLGYRTTGRPVALLPLGRGYVMVDDGEVAPVTDRAAARLSNTAVVLYRPLPARVRDVPGLLRFGFSPSLGHGRDLVRLAVTGVLVALLGLIIPVMTGKVLGRFVAEADRGLIVQGALLVIGSGLVTAALSVVQNIAVLRVESRTGAAMQAGLWNRLLSLPASFFTRYSTGELGTTVLGVTAAQELLSGMLTTATLALLTGLANLVLVFCYDLTLALVATALTAFGIGFAAVAGRFQLRWARREYVHEQAMSSMVFQMLTAMPKLRVAAAEERAFAEWSRLAAGGHSLSARVRRVQNAVTTFNAGFPLVCSAIVFAVTAGPLHGRVSLAVFLPFYAAFNLLLSAGLQFTASAVTAVGTVPMLERLRPILEAAPENDGTKADPGDLSGRITVSHLSFRYGQDGPLVLDDVSLTVQPGEFVAVVGASGSGKSTLLRLLLGFETPLAGSVLYDGQDLAELDISAVRRQCGVVLQNGALQAGDVLANIVGTSGYTLDEAWAAAEMAGLADDVRAMPMGMNTMLSEGTNTLSGGQRQRLMIARALVARPRLVFFDEATSALDNPTQGLVAESTRRLNATRLVIAHRLSTVVDADRIVVMDRGRVVQQGTYEELLADADGLFARLAGPQLS